LYPKTGSHPAIELFANSNEACNNFAKQSLHPNSKVTYYPTLSQRFHELQLQSFAQKFLTTTTKKKKKKLRYLEWLCQRGERSDNM
jgi:hypothetical protein